MIDWRVISPSLMEFRKLRKTSYEIQRIPSSDVNEQQAIITYRLGYHYLTNCTHADHDHLQCFLFIAIDILNAILSELQRLPTKVFLRKHIYVVLRKSFIRRINYNSILLLRE